MSFETWQNYIGNKSGFYSDLDPRPRSDSEFTWGMTSKPPTWRRYIKALPVLGRVISARRLRQSTPAIQWEAVPSSDKRAMHEVRGLLADETSRILFDEAIILRNVSHHRFFAARHAFEPFAEQKLAYEFNETGFPTTYNGLPIRIYRLFVAGHDIQVIAADQFPEMLNTWQQYLIKRDGLDFTPRRGDYVLDCGACIGDVSIVFAAMVGTSGKVFAFDPIPLHMRFCALQRRNNPALSSAIELIPKAVGANDRSGPNITDERKEISPGEFNIENFAMTTLDAFAKEHEISKVDLIKMDIEGAEREAIDGAKSVICEFKPRLAISTYHRPDDFWSIPLQIRDIGVGYKFAFEHHSPRNWESVIYAYH